MNENLEAVEELATLEEASIPNGRNFECIQNRPSLVVECVPESQSAAQMEINLVKERMNNPSMIPILKGPSKLVGFKVTGITKKDKWSDKIWGKVVHKREWEEEQGKICRNISIQ